MDAFPLTQSLPRSRIIHRDQERTLRFSRAKVVLAVVKDLMVAYLTRHSEVRAN